MIETGAGSSTDGHGGADTLEAAAETPFQTAFGGKPQGGDRLMRIGLVVSDLRGDFASVTYRLKAVQR
ncbi:hypothetical protein D3C73_1603460 [compost metagenome]